MFISRNLRHTCSFEKMKCYYVTSPHTHTIGHSSLVLFCGGVSYSRLCVLRLHCVGTATRSCDPRTHPSKAPFTQSKRSFRPLIRLALRLTCVHTTGTDFLSLCVPSLAGELGWGCEFCNGFCNSYSMCGYVVQCSVAECASIVSYTFCISYGGYKFTLAFEETKHVLTSMTPPWSTLLSHPEKFLRFGLV